MPGFVKTLCVTVILGGAVSLFSGATDAWGEDDETHFNLEAAWFVNPSGRGYRIEFEAALDGYCSPLLAKVRPEKLDWSQLIDVRASLPTIMRYWAAVRMYDSGLCVEADPKLGTRFFEHLVESKTRHIGIVYMELGWRAWHGVGMARDRDRARRYFERAVLNGLKFFWKNEDRVFHTRTGMSLPGYPRAIFEGFREAGQTPRARIDFAWDLFEGRATFPDGRSVPFDPHAISRILSNMPYHMDSNYLRGLVHREIERLGLVRDERPYRDDLIPDSGEVRFSEIFLLSAAGCGHLEAIKTGIEWLYDDLDTDRADPYGLMILLHQLEEHGYDAESTMRDVEERFPDKVLDRRDSLRAMKHLKTRQAGCDSYAEFNEKFH